MKYFIDKLITRVKALDSHICVGLDPHIELLPSHLLKQARTEAGIDRDRLAEGIYEFNRNIIDSIADIAPVVKPQIAFYELLGAPGIEVLEKTIKYARSRELIVILDAKRNDIGSTAAAYARAHLGLNKGDIVFTAENEGADAITINAYLGFDGVEPFIGNIEKGAFVLVKTSNPGSGDLQDLELSDGRKVFQATARLVKEWGSDLKGEYGYTNLGAVVGATYPRELKRLRQEIPEAYFLIPGFGAQGGGPEDIKYGFNDDGLGAIINSARGILFAWRKKPWSEKFGAKDYAAAARAAALKMRNEINEILDS